MTGSRYRRNFTSNAPVMSRYGTTHASTMTPAHEPWALNGSVASSTAEATPVARTMAGRPLDTTSTAAGTTTPAAT